MSDELETTSKLTEDARNGDKEAFISLTKTCMEKVARVCLYVTGNKAIAEEITQEAFLKAFTKIHSLKPGIPFENWVIRIAKNLAIDFYRKNKRKLPLDIEIDWGDPNDDAVVLDVRREIMNLPEKFRLPLLLDFYEGLTMGEISKLLKIPIGTVKSRIFHAKEKMKSILSGNSNERNR